MLLKDLIHTVWEISPSIQVENLPPSLLLGDENFWIIHMYQETIRHLASWFHHLFWTNTSTPLELATQNISVLWILWSITLLRFIEQSVIISSLIPVWKVPYQKLYLKHHTVRQFLQMCMPSNFHVHFKIQAVWLLYIYILIKWIHIYNGNYDILQLWY